MICFSMGDPWERSDESLRGGACYNVMRSSVSVIRSYFRGHRETALSAI